PSTLGDLWRHVTVWQFRAYIGEEDATVRYLPAGLGFAADQFGPLLGGLVLVLAVGGLLRLWQRDRALLLSTAITALATLIYTLNYQIREVVVYYVPLYMMFLLWAGAGLAGLLGASIDRLAARRGAARSGGSRTEDDRAVRGLGLILALVPL